ncbi:MAG TPA: hypothetical protein VK745_09670 [Polyangiaceae bacterium]|nr:hypothetical protein [Polyangiaceae bacterium]
MSSLKQRARHLASRVGCTVGLGLFASACSWVNAINVCEHVGPAQSRVNERGDGNEYINHPRAASDLGNGRVLVAFNAQSLDLDANGAPTTSDVRLTLLDAATGTPITLCDGMSLDETLEDSGGYAAVASVAPAPLTIGGNAAAALVAWTDLHTQRIMMRFVDVGGCPMEQEFAAREFSTVAGQTVADFAASVTWSPVNNAVLLTWTDQRDIFEAWISAAEPPQVLTLASGQTAVQSIPVSAVASDGRTLVAWSEDGRGVQGELLDAQGNATGTPFDLGFAAKGSMAHVAVIAGPDRFAVTADGSDTPTSTTFTYVREFSLSGVPLGATRRVDDSDANNEEFPVVAYLPDQTLMASWKGPNSTATSARLFKVDGTPRFNTVSCDEQQFRLDAAHPILPGMESALLVGGSVWVFYSGQPPSDPRGSGVGLWRLPFDKLYTGTQ